MKTSANWKIVVEPNELMRQGLMNVIVNAGCANCAAFESIEEMESNLAPEAQDGIFLVNLGDDEESIERAVVELKSRHPMSPIVLLAKKCSRRHLNNAIRAGVSGYILTSTSCDAFIKLIELVSLGQPVIPGEALDWIASDEDHSHGDAPSSKVKQKMLPPDLLSDRERVVLQCLCSAMSNKLIARECNICEATVKVHVKAILRKINGKNRTEAAIWALDKGLEPYKPKTNGVQIDAPSGEAKKACERPAVQREGVRFTA